MRPQILPGHEWLKDVNDDIYDPSYTDMLRVAFTVEFRRGKLQDLVALLSGRNFETKQYEEAIAEASFGRLKKGVLAFINKTHFDRFTMILRSAGFVTSRPDRRAEQPQLRLHPLPARPRPEGMPPPTSNGWCGAGTPFRISPAATRRATPRPLSTTTSARSTRKASTSTARQYRDAAHPNFWDNLLPLLDTASSNSAFFLAYQAAQVKLGDKGFLSRDITVHDLLLNRSDVHHVYPKNI